MSFFSQGSLPRDFPPFAAFREQLGFVPRLLLAQSLLPGHLEAEAGMAGCILVREASLSRATKERMLLAVAATTRNDYCIAIHAHALRSLGVAPDEIERLAADPAGAALSPDDRALVDFALGLASLPSSVGPSAIERLRARRFSDAAILEAVLTTALGRFLCTLSAGLGVEPDPETNGSACARPAARSTAAPDAVRGRAAPSSAGPYLAAPHPGDEFPPFLFFREKFEFVPNIFRAQTLRPDVVEAEARAVGTILLGDAPLTRLQKEQILLVVSAANFNSYCVAVHCEMLRRLGMSEEHAAQVAVDHREAELVSADAALLDFVLRLAREPATFGRADVEGLRRHGFTEEQVLQAVVMTGLTGFLNTVQTGLGPVTDFEPPPRRAPEGARAVSLFGGAGDRMNEAAERRAAEDKDAAAIASVRAGNPRAFEALVERHTGRVYRTLLAIGGNPTDAEDDAQTTFLRAFQHLGEFQGAAKFSTWLTRIAVNVGLRRLRRKRRLECLEEALGGPADDPSGYRPRHVLSWVEDAESLYSREETRRRVEEALMALPEKYRVVVMLRDIEQLSGEEAAAALGLKLPTMKTRLLRGRLMLREALAPHYARRKGPPRV